jgi:primosomal protein N' (replication factor Y) (superfamily II helicase)
MTERKTLFVDVIIPLSVKNKFTYRVPFELNDFVSIGVRVIVPFGKGKLYTAIVNKIHEIVPTDYQVKYVEHVLDEFPIVTSFQLKFWDWISAYYLAPIGDVMAASLPANFKLGSETKIVLHPNFNGDVSSLNDRQYQIYEALEIQEVLDLKEISEIVGIKTIQPIIKELIDLNVIITQEELSQKFIPKTENTFFIHPDYQVEEKLNELLNSFEKSKQKQFDALITILKYVKDENYEIGVPKKILLEESISDSTLATLEKKGVLLSKKVVIDRFKSKLNQIEQKKDLNEAQAIALDEIRSSFTTQNVCLLRGVTGSGKTEIYVDLIEEQIKKGNQVLFLLPEIALTAQLINRLSVYFGDLVGVYHSKFNQNERVEIWNHVLNNHPTKFRIILGARSSVFLPFQKLGLIIVDEEHESSFKQYEPSPRYNARDCSIVLASFFNAKVLLGSATPSIESYFNAKSGKYALVELNERYGNILLPEIFVADIKKEKKQNTMKSHFSSLLIEHIEEALTNNEQIILFQNRRGYTPLWSCEVCTWTPKCKNCDVSLTYHKHSNSLKCHYCSYVSPPIGICNNCGSNRLKMLGFGTEKIEDELALMFPTKKVARMDLDTTRSKNAYQNFITDFENRKTDILIGTQMISKGLDFDNVSLVGILDADMLLNRPDFRAFERGFHLMTQVAGRSGRKNKRGKVVIQTGNPDHWIIQKVIQHDFLDFYKNEIIERKNFHWPPFYKLIHFTFKHKDINVLNSSSYEFAESLKTLFKERVLGPEFPLIQRLNNLFLKQITLKIERDAPIYKVKEKIEELINQFYSKPVNKSVRLVVDVDPA